MPYECSMCNKKFRQKQGLNAHVKANRCKVALRGITNSPGSTSSTNSERSNSPRTVPYPTANQNRAPGLSPNIKPKENVLSPAALLKLLSQPITVSNHSHPYHHTPTLSPTNQISLTGLQNLSNLIQTMRENNLRLPQSTTIQPRPTAVQNSTSFQPRFPFTESTCRPLATQSEGSEEAEEVEIVELDDSSEDLMKIPSAEESRISSSSPTSDDSSSSTTVGNRKGRRKQGKYRGCVIKKTWESIIWQHEIIFVFSKSFKTCRHFVNGALESNLYN